MNNEIFLNGITIEQLATALNPLIHIVDKSVETISEDILLTIEETCVLLSIHKTTLWKHTKCGKLKSYGLGNRLYYKKNEVLEAVKPIKH
jgi:excisionase family DNA binding protein